MTRITIYFVFIFFISQIPFSYDIAMAEVEIILPEKKPVYPALKQQTVIPPIYPIQKPEYFGPFGPNYEYLLSKQERQHFSDAIKAAENRQWNKASEIARKINNPLGQTFITWLYLRHPRTKADFRFRSLFIHNHNHWPDISRIKQNAERFANDGSMDSIEIINWFENYPPVTGKGMHIFAKAYKKQNQEEKSIEIAKSLWMEKTLNRVDEKFFLLEFQSYLENNDHLSRVNNLIWNGKINNSRRMLKRLDRNNKRLAEARIALATSAYGVDSKIARVPRSLRNDEGLIYDRVKWRRKRGKYESAKKLIISSPYDDLYPNLWWKERQILARHSLLRNSYEEAYKIVSSYKSKESISISEAEWLLGWIQLNHFNQPEEALIHFYKLYDAVTFPVSVSRGAYWIARTLEKAGNNELAINWYNKAKNFHTTYYGQLASEKLGLSKMVEIPIEEVPTIIDRKEFNEIDLVQIVRMLAESEEKKFLRRFVLSASSLNSKKHKFLTAELISNLGRTDLGVWVSRRASQKNIFLYKHGYPIPNLNYPDIVDKAIILAIIRQESNFDAQALSRAGARGLMQLMPATARLVSRKLKERYDRDALTIDKEYNIRLGTNYFFDLLKEFKGSHALALAGYNAGPHRARRWIKQFGDPRTKEIDLVDWIEKIPFSETRNYVQRVLENYNVYKGILYLETKKQQPSEQTH